MCRLGPNGGQESPTLSAPLGTLPVVLQGNCQRLRGRRKSRHHTSCEVDSGCHSCLPGRSFVSEEVVGGHTKWDLLVRVGVFVCWVIEGRVFRHRWRRTWSLLFPSKPFLGLLLYGKKCQYSQKDFGSYKPLRGVLDLSTLKCVCVIMSNL